VERARTARETRNELDVIERRRVAAERPLVFPAAIEVTHGRGGNAPSRDLREVLDARAARQTSHAVWRAWAGNAHQVTDLARPHDRRSPRGRPTPAPGRAPPTRRSKRATVRLIGCRS